MLTGLPVGIIHLTNPEMVRMLGVKIIKALLTTRLLNLSHRMIV